MDRISFLRLFYYFLSFAVPPLVFGAVIIYKSISDISFSDPEAFDISSVSAPTVDEVDNDKLTAFIIVGNKGTEITDFLVPYQMLAETGSFNVFTVAPRRVLSPLNGGLDFVPHFSIGEVDDYLGKSPDLIVVPNIPNIQSPEDKVLIDWIRKKDDGSTVFLSICEGARTLAAAGLLQSKKATTHWSALSHLRGQYPGTEWLSGSKYVEDGNIITSPGVITGSASGTLHAVQKLLGAEKARQVANKINYENFKDNELAPVKIGLPDMVWLATALYPWSKDEIGVYINEGVGEIDLASILDVYPRSFTAVTYTFSEQRIAVKTKNGLDIVPIYDFKTIGYLDRLILLGEKTGTQALQFFNKYYKQIKPEILAASTDYEGRFAFDRSLLDLATRANVPITRSTAKTLEYPVDHLNLQGGGWPFGLLLGPLLLGMAGIAFARWFEKRYLT